jgi:hypothetical protein
MSKLHYIAPTVPAEASLTVRLGTTGVGKFLSADEGKFVKLIAESAYDLCAAGDAIEAVVTSVDMAPSGGFSIGGVFDSGRLFVTADGAQASPGTGTLAIGDYVVCGTVIVKNTALAAYPRVCKATDQPTAVPAALANVGPQIKNALFGWRVVSLGSAGTGAVGTTLVIARVCDM